MLYWLQVYNIVLHKVKSFLDSIIDEFVDQLSIKMPEVTIYVDVLPPHTFTRASTIYNHHDLLY